MIEAAKARKDEPHAKVHVNLINAAPPKFKKQAVEAIRNIEQIRNAQKLARKKDALTHDAYFNVYITGLETDFLDGYQLVPEIAFVGVNKG